MMIIFKEFRFEAAHFLPHVANGHKCSRMHGHSYLVRVELKGNVGQRTGWVRDYKDVARAWQDLHCELDHHTLNDIPGLENSTAEHLARWIWDRLIEKLPELHAVEVRETSTAGVRYQPASPAGS
jgi:6-pyruvoyltetrahydropterin/6-carboxytetrahydropterin synthase